jgi:hypothetical protein
MKEVLENPLMFSIAMFQEKKKVHAEIQRAGTQVQLNYVKYS